MILVQNYYKDKYEYRHSEIEKCLQMNCDNPHISKVVLLIETDVTPETISDKIVIVRVPSRPTYSELFKAANEASNPNDIVIISNSDIYFNESLNEAYNIGSDECYALSRWNMVGGRIKPFHYPDSQDVWIMRSPIKEMEADFTSGVPGCLSADSQALCYTNQEYVVQSIGGIYDLFTTYPSIEMRIRSIDVETNKIRYNRVVNVISSGVKPVFRVSLENGYYIDATADHRILVGDKFIPLQDLNIGDEVVCVNWPNKIVSIEPMGETMTYDITMEAPLSNFECNGIFVHNCDNKIAYILDQSGYTVTNPCSKIIAIHLHDGDRHNYTAKDRVPPPYLRVTPQ